MIHNDFINADAARIIIRLKSQWFLCTQSYHREAPLENCRIALPLLLHQSRPFGVFHELRKAASSSSDIILRYVPRAARNRVLKMHCNLLFDTIQRGHQM